MWRPLLALWLLAFGALSLIAWFFGLIPAHSAEMCAPTENPVVCSIIEQLDNTSLELAKAEGGRRVAVAKSAADQAWWKGYLAGEDEQAQKSTADREQLGAWWKAYDFGATAYRHATEDLGTQLAAHLQSVCGWKGTMNEPTAQLCIWWKGTLR